MKYPLFLLTALCSAIMTGGAVFIALVLRRLKDKAVIEPEYIVLPPTSSEMKTERQRERVLQSI